MLSIAFSPPLHRMPCQASDSLHMTAWKKLTGREDIFPWHHGPEIKSKGSISILVVSSLNQHFQVTNHRG